MSIGQVIKVVREERGLTQSQFAHELFVTQQALSRWEKGNGRAEHRHDSADQHPF